MKTCLCCLSVAKDDAFACANCGESSWSIVASTSIDAPRVPEGFSSPVPVVEPDAAIDASRVRRSRRAP